MIAESSSSYRHLFEIRTSPYDVSSDMDDSEPLSPQDDEVSSRTSTTDVDRDSLVGPLYGRLVQSTSEVYILPADTEEHRRLDSQHDMLKALFDGNLFYEPRLLHERLKINPLEPNNIPRVLDVGCGSGAWCIDLAEEYPNIQVTGLDLAPPYFRSQPPDNCNFEVDDVNLGLQHYANSFDVVHCSDISHGVTDYETFLRKDVLSVLKPGGLFLFVESDLQMYDDDWEAITAQHSDEPGFSWMQKMTFEGYSAAKNRGSNIDSCHLIERWFKRMGSSCWESWGYQSMHVPLGPYEATINEDENRRFMAERARENAIGLSRSLKPLLVSHGYFEHVVDRWISKVQEELEVMDRRLSAKWHFAWAVKRCT